METGTPPEQSKNQPVAANPTENNAAPRGAQGNTKARAIREWVITLGAALIVAWIIRSVAIEPFVVVGASMDPTFATGQFLLVDRLTYDVRPPARDEVIVFKYPDDPSEDYIKRIIGLPGETVIIRDGKVSIEEPNSSTSTPLDEPYVDPSHASHDDLTATLDSTHYFVMGDNRAESSDSRAWGPLPADDIIGRPILRLLPLQDISFLPGAYHQPAAPTATP